MIDEIKTLYPEKYFFDVWFWNINLHNVEIGFWIGYNPLPSSNEQSRYVVAETPPSIELVGETIKKLLAQFS